MSETAELYEKERQKVLEWSIP